MFLFDNVIAIRDRILNVNTRQILDEHYFLQKNSQKIKCKIRGRILNVNNRHTLEYIFYKKTAKGSKMHIYYIFLI